MMVNSWRGGLTWPCRSRPVDLGSSPAPSAQQHLYSCRRRRASRPRSSSPEGVRAVVLHSPAFAVCLALDASAFFFRASNIAFFFRSNPHQYGHPDHPSSGSLDSAFPLTVTLAMSSSRPGGPMGPSWVSTGRALARLPSAPRASYRRSSCHWPC